MFYFQGESLLIFLKSAFSTILKYIKPLESSKDGNIGLCVGNFMQSVALFAAKMRNNSQDASDNMLARTSTCLCDCLQYKLIRHSKPSLSADAYDKLLTYVVDSALIYIEYLSCKTTEDNHVFELYLCVFTEYLDSGNLSMTRLLDSVSYPIYIKQSYLY